MVEFPIHIVSSLEAFPKQSFGFLDFCCQAATHALEAGNPFNGGGSHAVEMCVFVSWKSKNPMNQNISNKIIT